MTRQTQNIEALYREIGPLIYSRSCRILKDRSAAEDATQDVFLRLIKSGSVPEGDARVPFVHRVTVNHCLNLLRNSSRRPSPTHDGVLPEHPAEGDPEQTAIENDFARQTMAKMPKHLRAPAELYHCKGMQQERIAEWLGVSRRTVIYRLAEFTERAARFAEAY
jgi:RNA polymerase sigma-70 factor (ECF subfamily)